MRLGLIARADNSGLGMQTWEFYRHMHPDKTMVVDISAFNKNVQYPHRYPDATFIYGFPQKEDVDNFLQNLDVVFIAEAAYNQWLYIRAKELGVKVAVQQNYEFNDWLVNPDFPKPDMLISPSMWHYNDVQKWCEENGVKHTYLHCPVDREKLKFREINQARTFLHMAGKSAAHDRNGTGTVIAASAYLQTDARIVIHFQGEQGLPHQATLSIDDYKQSLQVNGDPSKVTIVQQETVEYQDLYTMGDVLLLPRRYGGNCLPLNEALSVGMPVIMTDIEPNNHLLPKQWLVPAVIVNEFTPRTHIDIYGSEPRDLAAKIDEFFLSENMDVANQTASAIADHISWETMKPDYEKTLRELCNL